MRDARTMRVRITFSTVFYFKLRKKKIACGARGLARACGAPRAAPRLSEGTPPYRNIPVTCGGGQEGCPIASHGVRAAAEVVGQLEEDLNLVVLVVRCEDSVDGTVQAEDPCARHEAEPLVHKAKQRR